MDKIKMRSRMMRINKAAAAHVLLVGLIVAGCGGNTGGRQLPSSQSIATDSGEAKKEIVVGYTSSLTGRFSTEGNYHRMGYELWAEQINAQGGLMLNGQRVRVRLYGLDDQSDAQTAVKLYERLMYKDKVDLLLGPWGSGINFAVSALTEREGWPLIMPSGSSDALFERGFKRIFQATTLASQLVRPLVDYMKNNPDIKTVAIAYENFLLTQQLHDFFLKESRDASYKVVIDEQYPLSGKEFGGIVAKMRSANPDAVVLFNIMPSPIYFVRKLDEVQWRPKLLVTAMSLMFHEFHEAVGDSANGIVELGFLHPKYSPESQQFWDAFQDRYGVMANTDAAHAYVAAQVLGQAVEKANSLDREKLVQVLHTETFKTAQGDVKYDEAGRNTALVPFLTQWLDKQRTIVWPREKAERELVYPWPPK